MNSDINYFLERQKKFSQSISELEKKSRIYSNLRLLSFCVFIIFTFLFVRNISSFVYAFVALLALVGFITLCVVHGKLFARIKHLKSSLEVVDRYIGRINGDFSVLPDKGIEFLDKNHAYAYDLDIFGDVSVFALYNTSHTYLGRKEFADMLLGQKSCSNIKESQGVCQEFINSVDFMIDYESNSIDGNLLIKPETLIELYESNNSISSSEKILYKSLPFLWLIPLILLVVGSKFASVASLLIFAINLIIWFVSSSKYGVYFKKIQGISRQSKFFENLFLLLESFKTKNSYLKELIRGGASEGKLASEGLSILSHALSLASWRQQPISALILNVIFPYDLLCMDKLLSWAKNYGSEFEISLKKLSLIECLMSASVPGIVSRESVFPDISEGAFFDGVNITHPLLDPSSAVSNTIKLDKQLALITGSNMSGKTTLIRTIGIVSVLSYIGAPVPASSCKLGRMRVVSSMRIVDSIEERMSTFRAELVRIGKIVEASKTEEPLLFLIDEIFRGTNSQDRTDGALAVLRNLDRKYITGLMTTHDYALCDKVSDEIKSVVYYHFSEEYVNNEIIFDYKLHDGVSHKSNAKYLMRLVGIES